MLLEFGDLLTDVRSAAFLALASSILVVDCAVVAKNIFNEIATTLKPHRVLVVLAWTVFSNSDFKRGPSVLPSLPLLRVVDIPRCSPTSM